MYFESTKTRVGAGGTALIVSEWNEFEWNIDRSMEMIFVLLDETPGELVFIQQKKRIIKSLPEINQYRLPQIFLNRSLPFHAVNHNMDYNRVLECTPFSFVLKL